MNTKFTALVVVPVLSALAIYYGLTEVLESRKGPSLFLAVAVGVLLHFGVTKIHRYHFPPEEGEIRRPPGGVKRFWMSLYNLCLFSGLGAGLAWVAFLGTPLCYVLTLGAGALTYRLLLPLFGPDGVPQRGRRRMTPPPALERGEARLAVGDEELSFGRARLPGLVGVEVWRSVKDIPDGDERGGGAVPAADGTKTKKARPRVRRVK